MSHAPSDPAPLTASIQRLYDVFAGYDLPEPLDSCACCVGAEDQRRIRARPLRELGWEELARYAWKAMSTWGGTDAFCHFLPRLLELAVTDPDWPQCHEVLFSKLAYGGWQTWPEEERLAVADFLHAWWEQGLAAFPARPDASTRLCCIAATGAELSPFLARWRELDTPDSARHLAHLVASARLEAREPPDLGAFWEQVPSAESEVIAWMLEPSTCEILERASRAGGETGEASQISAAMAQLAAMRAHPSS